MSFIRAELKAKAKADLKGNMGTAIGAMVVTSAIAGAAVSVAIVPYIITMVSSAALIRTSDAAAVATMLAGMAIYIALLLACIFLVAYPLSMGTYCFYLRGARTGKHEFKDVFGGFKFYGKSIGLAFMVGLFTYLWSLLFYVPGFIKAYSYSMSYWELANDPSISVMEAIRRSKTMTNGYKGKLFVLDLSFMGWMLLAACTCSIGSFFLTPYMNATYANAYLKLKELNDSKV